MTIGENYSVFYYLLGGSLTCKIGHCIFHFSYYLLINNFLIYITVNKWKMAERNQV